MLFRFKLFLPASGWFADIRLLLNAFGILNAEVRRLTSLCVKLAIVGILWRAGNRV